MSTPNRAERIKASSFSATAEESSVQHSHKSLDDHHDKKRGFGGGWLVSILMFVFFVFIVFILLVAWAPKWLQKKRRDRSLDDGEKGAPFGRGRRSCLDYGKTFLWALVISVIAVLLFWLLAGVTAGVASLFMGKRGSKHLKY